MTDRVLESSSALKGGSSYLCGLYVKFLTLTSTSFLGFHKRQPNANSFGFAHAGF